MSHWPTTILGGIAGGTLGVLGIVALSTSMLLPASWPARHDGGQTGTSKTVPHSLGRRAVPWCSLLGPPWPNGRVFRAEPKDFLGKGPQSVTAWLTTLLIGFLAMGLLPTMERWFDRVTGMTLADFVILATLCCRSWLLERNVRPSLQVASLVEAGVWPLAAMRHWHVGVLYHDIGKMRSPNTSSKINQARTRTTNCGQTSYLIIAGHVKDGLEMAAASGLPKSREFITSHHGTQVVRWFYIKARDAATEDEEVEEPHSATPGPVRVPRQRS